jgi:fructose-bisphosphate aldolase class II
MKSLREILIEGAQKKTAIGHFNFSDLTAFRAIADASRELSLPVMVGLSEGERTAVSPKTAAALVSAARAEGVHIFLNADHTHSLDAAKIAAEAGFDEIIFDASRLPYEENLQQTIDAVRELKKINPELLIEGELGFIGANSQVLDVVPEESRRFTDPAQAAEFCKATGIDVLAPAVGTMHGMVRAMVSGNEHKHLDIPRIKQLSDFTGLPITLHGGSGTEDSDFVAGIEAGLRIVHVNTELRLAWREGMQQSLDELPNEIAPYKLMKNSYVRIKEIVSARLKLFNQIPY